MTLLIGIWDKNRSCIVLRVYKEEEPNNEAEHVYKLSNKFF